MTTALRVRVMTALVLAAGMLAILLWLPPVATVIAAHGRRARRRLGVVGVPARLGATGTGRLCRW